MKSYTTLKRQCQLQCIARSNNAWRPFYWQSNSCFGFQSVIYFNHPMVILAHFNRIVTTKHQRNVYNRYLLTFHHFQGKCKQMHCGWHCLFKYRFTFPLFKPFVSVIFNPEWRYSRIDIDGSPPAEDRNPIAIWSDLRASQTSVSWLSSFKIWSWTGRVSSS